MTDWVHIGFEIALILSSLTLAVYSFRLFNKFKGGMFGSTFRIFGFAALLLAVAYAFDVILDWMKVSSTEYKYFYFILSLFFLVFIFYGVHKLYKAWTKLGVK